MDEQVDSLSLRIAARSRRKSIGQLTRLLSSSLALVWESGRRLFLVLIVAWKAGVIRPHGLK